MKGIGASPGFAVGRVVIKKAFKEPVKSFEDDIASSIEKLERAKEIVYKKLSELDKSDSSSIFAAHQMILNDPEMQQSIKKLIEEERYEIGYAVKVVRDQLIDMFSGIQNDYIRERQSDIRDVCNNLIKVLHGYEEAYYEGEEPIILVAHDLTPSDTTQISKDKVAGFLIEMGSQTSHTAILSRMLEIPAVVGVKDLLNKVSNGDVVMFDGQTGDIVLHPSEDEQRVYEEKNIQQHKMRALYQTYKGRSSVSKDGVSVCIGCNIGQPEDLSYVKENDGTSIGLFRSEFLFMNRDEPPTEEEQFQAYKQVLSEMKGSVVIRTLDVGGDKMLTYLDFPKEDNPFLGYRAIRYCLDHDTLFLTQLRSLLRASIYGDLKVMFPMISCVEEFLKAKEMLKIAHKLLESEGFEVGEYEVGIMIEVPSAALTADILAKEVDFFSIGTNDLIQYTTAVDRMHPLLSNLYTVYHPAVLRLIQQVVDAAHKEGKWVGMCGEAAADPVLLPILFEMGLDELSMSASNLLKSRYLLHQMDKRETKKMLDHVMTLRTSHEIKTYLKNHAY